MNNHFGNQRVHKPDGNNLTATTVLLDELVEMNTLVAVLVFGRCWETQEVRETKGE